jgi:hypothetical protein
MDENRKQQTSIVQSEGTPPLEGGETKRRLDKAKGFRKWWRTVYVVVHLARSVVEGANWVAEHLNF